MTLKILTAASSLFLASIVLAAGKIEPSFPPLKVFPEAGYKRKVASPGSSPVKITLACSGTSTHFEKGHEIAFEFSVTRPAVKPKDWITNWHEGQVKFSKLHSPFGSLEAFEEKAAGVAEGKEWLNLRGVEVKGLEPSNRLNVIIGAYTKRESKGKALLYNEENLRNASPPGSTGEGSAHYEITCKPI